MTQGSGPDVGKCASCGAALTPEDYNAPACRFCGAAHVHHLRAAEKVAQVQGVMAGMIGQMNMYGAAPMQGGMNAPPGAFPGGPGAFAPPPGGYPGYPSAQGAAVWQNVQGAFVVQNQVSRAASGVLKAVILMFVLMFLVIGAAVGVILLRME